jgi:opacity protein-like surface antigen
MKKTVIAIAAMLASLGAAQAQTATPQAANAPVRFLVGLGATFGGDNLAEAVYTNGSHQQIKAGSGVVFTTGIDYRLSPEFSVQGTLNFHVDDTSASNGSIKFQRFPVELLAYFHPNAQWRVGGGVRYVNSPKLSSSGAAAGINLTFDNTTSAVVEAEYFWTERASIKMRFVKEAFKAPHYTEVKADHFGISANFYF